MTVDHRSTEVPGVGPPRPRDHAATYERYRERKLKVNQRRLAIWALLVVVVSWGIWSSGFGLGSLFDGLTESFRFLAADAIPPRLEAVPDLIGPTLETLYMSVAALVMSIFISIPVGIMAARNTSPHRIVSYAAKGIAGFARAVPSLVLTVFVVAVVGIGPLAGALALGIGGVGILGKVYGDSIEEIDMRQIEGLRSTGASWIQILAQGVWPQFKPAFVTWTLYRFERNIRGGAVLGLVGGGGLGFSLMSAISLYQFRTACTIILMIFALVLLIDLATNAIRRRVI